MEFLKQYLNDDDFMKRWQEYIATPDYSDAFCWITDIINNFKCEGIPHLKATDIIRKRLDYLYEDMYNNLIDEEYDEEIMNKIYDETKNILKTDVEIIKMLVTEW